jgi:DNA adenine methylase
LSTTLPTTTAIAPWFGSSRTIAPQVGEELTGCEWVGIPFMGGGCELLHIKARTIVASDLHYHVINLAMALAHETIGPQLYRKLRRKIFHEDELAAAQQFCQDTVMDEMPDLEMAEAYFVSQWMGRSGKAGTKGEFKGKLPVRWNAGGGDSAVRYQSAVRSLIAWRRVIQRVNFVCEDAFEFIGKCHDAPHHGLYVDAPWPEDGEDYLHGFTEFDQERLANLLTAFQHTRVVVRFGDHPLIRELYSAGAGWCWREIAGRTQANKVKREVLIVRNGK